MTNEGQMRLWNNPNFLASWKATEPTIGGLSVPLLAALDPRPGEAIVDIGCGGGMTTVMFSEAVAPDGRALGVDISAPLLELARQRAAGAGRENASFFEADAQVADLPGSPFDAATSRLGVMFFSDPPAAFANIRRHLKPGGRIVFVCFQAFAENIWYPADILQRNARGEGLPRAFPPPSPFALGNRAATAGYLETAGFEDVSLVPLSIPWREQRQTEPYKLNVVGLQLPPVDTERVLAEVAAYHESTLTNGFDLNPRNFWIVSGRNPD